MRIGKSKYSKICFWGIIIIGMSLPITGMVLADVLFDPSGLPETLKLLPSFFISPIGILVLLWNAVPFIFFALLTKSILSELTEDFQISWTRMAGVIGAGIAIISTSICFRIYVGWAVIRGLPGSSTAALMDLILPIYLFIIMGIGYWIGLVIGKLLSRQGK